MGACFLRPGLLSKRPWKITPVPIGPAFGQDRLKEWTQPQSALGSMHRPAFKTRLRRSMSSIADEKQPSHHHLERCAAQCGPASPLRSAKAAPWTAINSRSAALTTRTMLSRQALRDFGAYTATVSITRRQVLKGPSGLSAAAARPAATSYISNLRS